MEGILEVATIGERFTVHTAFIRTSDNSCYEVKLTVPNSQPPSVARLDGDWRLFNLLRGEEESIKKCLLEATEMTEALVRIKQLLCQLEKDIPTSHTLSLSLSVCRQLATELDSIGWARVVSVDALFRHIQLLTNDKRGREHTLTVSPTPKYPIEVPGLTVDAPLPYKAVWEPKSGLCGLMSHFTAWLDSLDIFWSTMEEVDKATCVLEPEHSTRAHTHRRVLIDTNLSLVLSVSPLKPLSFPEPLSFLGPDNKVTELKQKVSLNFSKWKESLSLVTNLEALLELQFPAPTLQLLQGISEECGICYDYRLEGSVPSVVCPNTHCAKCYHTECFKEWLKQCSSNGLGLSGECPFCEQVISLK